MVDGTAGKLFPSDSSGSRIGLFLSEVHRLIADRDTRFDEEEPSGKRPTGASDEHRTVGPQLKPPEERIVEIVSQNGDGIKQRDIVDAIRWSESTVSRKLCELEANGAVVRYQVGREKMVYLPGHEPSVLAPA